MVSLKRERGWADMAHTTEWAEGEGGGIANTQNGPVLKSPIEFRKLTQRAYPQSHGSDEVGANVHEIEGVKPELVRELGTDLDATHAVSSCVQAR